MKKQKSFSLIEMIVSIGIIILLAVAFTPGLTKHQQQIELEAAVQQIQNAVYETRSLAISPNYISNAGRMMQHYILILNITGDPKTYVTQWGPPYTGSLEDCRLLSSPFPDGCKNERVSPKSYTIYAVENMDLSFERHRIKQINYPRYISLFYDYPCRDGATAPTCPSGGGAGESFFLKPHFRSTDGMIGFNGRYFDNPDSIGGIETDYWKSFMWGIEGYGPDTPRQTKLVIVWGNNSVSNPENTFDTNLCGTDPANQATFHKYTDPAPAESILAVF